MMIKLRSLNRSDQFKQILKKNKISTKYFTIYFANKLIIPHTSNEGLNISFITKKKIGNAVRRNKIKRRLRAAVHKTFNEGVQINKKYVYLMFGKSNIYNDEFSSIYNDVKKTFKKINQNEKYFDNSN